MQAEIDTLHPKSSAKTHVAWPHIVLAIIGLALSIYAVRAHALVEAGHASGCSISESFSCDAVIGSKWGEFAGIPLGYYGVIFWIIVAITAISGAGVSPKSAAVQRLGVATVGLLFSLGLFYIAEFVIDSDKHCPICLGTHFTSLINFIFALFGWRRAAKIHLHTQ